MKKSDVFIIPYIIFLIVCCFVRFEKDYSLWPRIVSGATITSALFAFSELTSVLSTKAVSLESEAKAFIEQMGKRITEINQQFILFQEHIKEKQESSNRHTPAIDNYLERIKHNIKVANTIRDKTQKYIEKYHFYIFNFNLIGTCLIGIGFFAFLCILAFDNLAASMYEAQSMLTVISLAIVLLTQYISSKLDIWYQKRKKENQETSLAFAKIADDVHSINLKLEEALGGYNHAD